MNTWRDITRRLRGIRQTEQILRAMKLVAVVMLRRAQAAARAGQPFADRLDDALRDWAAGVGGSRGADGHPLCAVRPARHVLWAVLAADRGLCGGLNAALQRRLAEALRDAGAAEVGLWLIGRKAADIGRALQARFPAVRLESGGTLAAARAEPLAAEWSARFRAGALDRVELFHTACASAWRQQPVRAVWLPLAVPAAAPGAARAAGPLLEPSGAALTDALLERVLAQRLRTALQAARTAEHSARMLLMDQAGRNAGDMIETIRREANALRQAQITRELADITTGAGSLAAAG